MNLPRMIINRRCDEPMRRSKEKCNTPYHKRWKCNEDCKNCICCIQMDEQGNESHVNVASKARYIEL